MNVFVLCFEKEKDFRLFLSEESSNPRQIDIFSSPCHSDVIELFFTIIRHTFSLGLLLTETHPSRQLATIVVSLFLFIFVLVVKKCLKVRVCTVQLNDASTCLSLFYRLILFMQLSILMFETGNFRRL